MWRETSSRRRAEWRRLLPVAVAVAADGSGIRAARRCTGTPSIIAMQLFGVLCNTRTESALVEQWETLSVNGGITRHGGFERASYEFFRPGFFLT